MNPISLKLENFRSYKTVEFNFDHDGVIPIVGKNGHGKSTLFYGILLALYGKVLFDGVEASIKDLISNDGSKEMRVVFCFSHEGKIYRVERIYQISKTGKGVEKCDQVKCELYLLSGDKEIPLSSKSKQTTSAKIVDILGKDCDNFCNSAFFPQGEENRLAKLKPAEFIEEISKLKKIVVWEELRTKAKKRLDTIIVELSGAGVFIDECQRQIERKPEVQTKINELNGQILLVKDEIENTEANYTEILNEKAQLEALVRNITQIEAEVKAITKEVLDLRAETISIDHDISKTTLTLSRKSEVQAKVVELRQVEQRKSQLDSIGFERGQVSQQIGTIEEEVRKAEQGIRLSLQDFTTRYNTAVTAVNNKPQVEQRLAYCHSSIVELDAIEQQKQSADASNQAITIEITKLNSRNEYLSQLINDETAKANRIIQHGICLECERAIDPSALEAIKSTKSIKIDAFNTEGRQNVQRIDELKGIYQNQLVVLGQLNERLKARNSITREVGQLELQLNSIRIAEQELSNYQLQINSLNQSLEMGTYSNRFAELVSLRERLLSFQYDQNEHNLISQTFESLRNYDVLKRDIDNADAVYPNLIERKNNTQSKIDHKQIRIKELEAALISSNAADANTRLVQVGQKEEQFKVLLNQKRVSLNNFMKEFGAQQEVMVMIQDKEVKMGEKIKEVKEKKNTQYLLERAMDMYSKTGIPTLVIESMLPEIEEEANRLLRLMNAEKTITFERAAKSDGSIQDKIVPMIRDRRAQKRPFNTFSGAECFQISFALRVAICGAEEVMFIDEGFGKLDEDNLKLIIGTLASLKTRFNKIILITHIKELIEMFNVKLSVSLDYKGYSSAKWILS